MFSDPSKRKRIKINAEFDLFQCSRLTHPSIKGTSRKTFITTSIRSSKWIADAVCCVHIDMRFIIIVVKHKPHNLKNSVRFRRRISSYIIFFF